MAVVCGGPYAWGLLSQIPPVVFATDSACSAKALRLPLLFGLLMYSAFKWDVSMDRLGERGGGGRQSFLPAQDVHLQLGGSTRNFSVSGR